MLNIRVGLLALLKSTPLYETLCRIALIHRESVYLVSPECITFLHVASDESLMQEFRIPRMAGTGANLKDNVEMIIPSG
jgi:hypothetical protein